MTTRMSPAPSAPPPMGVLTGSEDGSLIRALYTKTGVVVGGRGALYRPAEVGTHAGGTAVRAISLVPECAGGGLGPNVGEAPKSYILLSAGAKEVLMAWRVAWVYTEGGGGGGGGGDNGNNGTGGGQGGWDLRTSLVASRGTLTKRGHVEWKKGCGSVAVSTESDQRYMAVTGFFPPAEHGAGRAAGAAVAGVGCLALAAMSEGSVTAMALEGEHGRRGGGGGWRPVASLRHHTRPVLSLAVTAVTLADDNKNANGSAIIACSGATDGTIAVWDLTALSASHAAAAGASGAGIAPPPPVELITPSVLIPSSHQSGVNSIAAAPAPGGVPGRLLVASGGDDQVLRVTLLSVLAGVGVSVTRTVSVDFAHSSAIKGVCMTHGGVIATTSHDQRLRVWAVAGTGEEEEEEEKGRTMMNVTVAPIAGSFVECPEPEGLDAWVEGGGSGDDLGVCVAVCGRGVQMFHLR